MSRYLLDTDHLSLFQRGHAELLSRLRQVNPQDMAISVITAEEQLRGRLAQIRAAKDESSRVQAYRWFHETVRLLRAFVILDYDDVARGIFDSLRRESPTVGTQDLRIAAVSLATGSTLLTRNARDFGQVKNLRFEDWSR